MEKNEEKKKSTSLYTVIKEILIYAIVAIVIVVPIRLWIAQPFVVSGDSMDDTFQNGQYLIINELAYEFGTPQRGDVVIFKYPLNTNEYFIKRVIGLPGETVVHKQQHRDDNTGRHNDTFVLNEPYAKGMTFGGETASETTTLKAGEYFVMGDNRMVSDDSRFWGPVPSYDLVGTPVLRLLPLQNFGTDPGKKTFSE